MRALILLAVAAPLAAQAPVRLELGPEVLASVNEDGGWLRVEPSIALAGTDVVVAWNDSWAGHVHRSAVGVGIGWSVSSDGGRSFRFGGYMPGTSGADSWLATTRREEILLQVLSWTSDEQTISVYALTPGRDRTWTRRGMAAGGSSAMRIDKPAMATAGDNWVGIAYSAGPEIHVVRSTDGGATWSPPARVSTADARLRTGAAIAACGTGVLVAWTEGGGLSLTEVWAAWSADGGGKFSEPARVKRLEQPVLPPPGYALGIGPAAFISNNAWLACSGTDQPVFHLTYGEGRAAGSVAPYQAARIVEGQLRWEPPEIVAGGHSVWAVWPSVAVLGNDVAILYYDSRHTEGDRPLMDAYLSVGTSGAFVDYRLSTVSSSWRDVPAIASTRRCSVTSGTTSALPPTDGVAWRPGPTAAPAPRGLWSVPSNWGYNTTGECDARRPSRIPATSLIIETSHAYPWTPHWPPRR